MSRTLYLLRHGQTRYNAEQRLQGRCNSDLTDRGEAQATAMGARLRDVLDEPARWTLYASPLGRARQTALLVCQQLGLDSERIVWDERLVELNMGSGRAAGYRIWWQLTPSLISASRTGICRRPVVKIFNVFSAGPNSGCRMIALPSPFL